MRRFYTLGSEIIGALLVKSSTARKLKSSSKAFDVQDAVTKEQGSPM